MTNLDRQAVSDQSLRLARELLDALGIDRARSRFVIGVAGESGSGKSVVATSMARELARDGREATVLHQDDYFVRPPRTNHDFRMKDIAANTGPHEVRLDLMAEHIAAFRRGESAVRAPIVNYPANRFDEQLHNFSHGDVLLVEGTYVLGLADLDARIFLTATHHDTAERRRARNRDIEDPRLAQILGIEHDFIAPQVELADLLIDRHFAVHRR